MFATTYHDDAIMAALTTCGLADFLQALPDGLDTRLGDGQRTLSPGDGNCSH
jgi:ABC-type multidrug transport system fused ATPase/permease subunit